MKNDFNKMEDEMDLLAKNMESITTFSAKISSTLQVRCDKRFVFFLPVYFQDTREQINKLSGVHTLLKRLQFLFKLPVKLKIKMEEKNYTEVTEGA